MSMEYAYGKEKLTAAILILVKGQGRIKERLFEVMDRSGFAAIGSSKDNLPPELLNRYMELDKRLALKNIEAMSEGEAEECAQEIFNLYYDVTAIVL